MATLFPFLHLEEGQLNASAVASKLAYCNQHRGTSSSSSSSCVCRQRMRDEFGFEYLGWFRGEKRETHVADLWQQQQQSVEEGGGSCSKKERSVLVAFCGTKRGDLGHVLSDIGILDSVMEEMRPHAKTQEERLHAFWEHCREFFGDPKSQSLEWIKTTMQLARRASYGLLGTVGGAIGGGLLAFATCNPAAAFAGAGLTAGLVTSAFGVDNVLESGRSALNESILFAEFVHRQTEHLPSVLLTGHSLGGYLAEYCGLLSGRGSSTKKVVITWNAPGGAYFAYRQRTKEEVTFAQASFHHVMRPNDIIARFGSHQGYIHYLSSEPHEMTKSGNNPSSIASSLRRLQQRHTIDSICAELNRAKNAAVRKHEQLRVQVVEWIVFLNMDRANCLE